MDQSQSDIMTVEGTDLSTDVLSIDGDQPLPERLSILIHLERAVQSTKVPREQTHPDN